MKKSIATVIGFLWILSAAHPVEAAIYYDHVRYTRSGQNNLRTHTTSARYPTNSTHRCLYYNASGVCMIEQYIDLRNYDPYYSSSTYDRDYLRRERRYYDRDYYDDYDDDDEEWEDIKDDFFDDDDD